MEAKIIELKEDWMGIHHEELNELLAQGWEVKSYIPTVVPNHEHSEYAQAYTHFSFDVKHFVLLINHSSSGM